MTKIAATPIYVKNPLKILFSGTKGSVALGLDMQHWGHKPDKHYENTPIQIHWKFYYQKMAIFQIKNSDIFYISAQNIDCGYSLEPPRRCGSNEYQQSMFFEAVLTSTHNLCFWAEIRKIMYTPVNPSFTI